MNRDIVKKGYDRRTGRGIEQGVGEENMVHSAGLGVQWLISANRLQLYGSLSMGTLGKPWPPHLKTVLLTKGDLAPQGHLGISGGIFVDSTTGIQWVESSDAVKQPTMMDRVSPRQRTI